MHVLRNKDGQLFSKLDGSYGVYEPVWIYPSQGGAVTIYPLDVWPKILDNIERNFDIKLEGEIVEAALPPIKL